jgi:hypothetical protein
MNSINDPIVTPAKIAKALRINAEGVERLAAFVCAGSTDPWRVFEGCQQQRVKGSLERSEQSSLLGCGSLRFEANQTDPPEGCPSSSLGSKEEPQ